MVHRIFLKFYMKLAGLNGQKLRKPNFSEKFPVLGGKPKISTKIRLFRPLSKVYSIDVYFLPKKWCITVFFMLIQKPLVWKNMSLQLWPKMLVTNWIAVSFDHQYPLKKSIDTLDFLHRDNDHQRKVASTRLDYFWLGITSCASLPIRF